MTRSTTSMRSRATKATAPMKTSTRRGRVATTTTRTARSRSRSSPRRGAMGTTNDCVVPQRSQLGGGESVNWTNSGHRGPQKMDSCVSSCDLPSCVHVSRWLWCVWRINEMRSYLNVIFCHVLCEISLRSGCRWSGNPDVCDRGIRHYISKHFRARCAHRWSRGVRVGWGAVSPAGRVWGRVGAGRPASYVTCVTGVSYMPCLRHDIA